MHIADAHALESNLATVGQDLLEVGAFSCNRGAECGVKRYIFLGGARLAGLTLRNNCSFIGTIVNGNSNFVGGIAMTFGLITVQTRFGM